MTNLFQEREVDHDGSLKLFELSGSLDKMCPESGLRIPSTMGDGTMSPADLGHRGHYHSGSHPDIQACLDQFQIHFAD